MTCGDAQPGLLTRWRKRLFAFTQAHASARYEKHVEERKRRLLGDLHGTVVEIGPGTGVNLPFLPRDVRWIGIEPNPYMHAYLRERARELSLDVDVRAAWAENIDLPDASADAVVSTLVLCSVADPQRTMREIHRILRPGGKFVFIEHVAAPPGTFLRRVQRFICPAWRFVGDNCHPDRETLKLIQSAGFSLIDVETFRVPIPPISPHIAGVAIK